MSSVSQRSDIPGSSIGSDSQQRLSLKDYFNIGAVAAFFIGAAYAMDNAWIRDELFNMDHLRARFQNHEPHVQLLFLLAAAGLNAVGVPRIWVSAVAGTLFGAVGGAAIALVATLGGSSINFFAGRHILRASLLRMLPGRMLKWVDSFSHQGFRFVIYLRLFPLTNSTLTNFVCGVSSIRFTTFIAATILGYLPLTIIFATLGSSAAKANHLQMGIGLALFVALSGGRRIAKKIGLGDFFSKCREPRDGQSHPVVRSRDRGESNSADFFVAEEVKG